MITWRPAVLVGAGAACLVVTATVRSGAAWPWLAAAGIVVIVAAVTALDFALAAPLGGVSLRRDGDRSTWLGHTATVTLRIGNESARTLRADVRDAWVPSAGATPYSHRVEIPPGTARRVTTTLTPIRRGDRPAVRVVIRSYGPMRLAYRQSSRQRAGAETPAWVLRVYPPFGARRFLPEKLAKLRVLDGATVTRGRGQGTEFDTLREYVAGDDVRSIDWRASARRSDVMVRTWRPERDRRVLCVLDTGRTSAARVGDEPRLDSAIDAALLLASLASRAGDRVDLLAVDTAVRASVTSAGRQAVLWRLANAMAPLAPALVETDFGLVTGEVLRRARKRALVVLFTALEPGALGEGLLPVLPHLTARHKVVVAALHDPTLARLASVTGHGADMTGHGADMTGHGADMTGHGTKVTGHGTDMTGHGTTVTDHGAEVTEATVYTAAAAQRTLADRDRVRAALTRHGVEVIDEPADIFASRVADAYLAMKAAGRL